MLNFAYFLNLPGAFLLAQLEYELKRNCLLEMRSSL